LRKAGGEEKGKRERKTNAAAAETETLETLAMLRVD